MVTDGTFLALLPDPSHPTGKAICLKGKAAPEIVYHESRLLHPLRRTSPKDSADPGWEQITWDEALDAVADRMLTLATSDGPESVGFSSSSPSTSAISDAVDWVQRLIRAFGSPNYCNYMELCGWGRYLAPLYTFGASVPGVYLPDLENAGCILFWGYNPSVARLAHATSTVAAVARGAKLIVVDPRKAGLAAKADHWLRVSPGTDAALALSLTHVMIENGWYDADFVRDWTNAADEVDGRTVWDLLASRCAEFPPDVAAEITGSAGRGHRRRGADALGGPAGRVLHVERAGAAQRHDADHARDQRALRADREPGRPGRERAVRSGAVEPDRRDGVPVRLAPAGGGRRQAAARAGPVRVRHRRGLLHRGPRPADQGAGQLRRQHGDGPRRQRPRPRCAAKPGLLRPGRPVHDPDRRARRHRAARDDAVRVRGTEDRLRVQPGGAVARPAATAARPAARRGPLGPADRVRPRDPAGSRRRTSGTATSRRRSAISSRRAGSPWRSCGPTRLVCGCR